MAGKYLLVIPVPFLTSKPLYSVVDSKYEEGVTTHVVVDKPTNQRLLMRMRTRDVQVLNVPELITLFENWHRDRDHRLSLSSGGSHNHLSISDKYLPATSLYPPPTPSSPTSACGHDVSSATRTSGPTMFQFPPSLAPLTPPLQLDNGLSSTVCASYSSSHWTHWNKRLPNTALSLHAQGLPNPTLKRSLGLALSPQEIAASSRSRKIPRKRVAPATNPADQHRPCFVIGRNLVQSEQMIQEKIESVGGLVHETSRIFYSVWTSNTND